MWQNEIALSENIGIQTELKERVNTLNAVTITAGSFAAADESRASILKPLYIYNGLFKGYVTADYGNLSYNVPTAQKTKPC